MAFKRMRRAPLTWRSKRSKAHQIDEMGANHILIEPRARRPFRFGQIIELEEPRFGNLVIALLWRRLLEIQNFEQHDMIAAPATIEIIPISRGAPMMPDICLFHDLAS